MMFHHPGMVMAAAVGGLQLRQRVLVELEFGAFLPRARQLQLIKDAEFHDVSPAIGLLFWVSVFAARPKSSVSKSSVSKSSVSSPAFRISVLRKVACAVRTNG